PPQAPNTIDGRVPDRGRRFAGHVGREMGAELFLLGLVQTVAKIAKSDRVPNAGKRDGIDACAALLAGFCTAVEGHAEFLPGVAFFDAGSNALRCKLTM